MKVYLTVARKHMKQISDKAEVEYISRFDQFSKLHVLHLSTLTFRLKMCTQTDLIEAGTENHKDIHGAENSHVSTLCLQHWQTR